MKYSENNKPLVCMQTNSRCYKKTTEFKPKGILWHSTGANNPNIHRYVQPLESDTNYDEMIKLLGKNKYKNDWNHKQVDAGLNCWIGKIANGTVTTVQTMPWNYKPWGCGGGSKGSCNNTHIQFEICEGSLSDKNYFNKVYQEACEITAYLCKMYDLDPKGTFTYKGMQVPVILCHADAHKLKLGSNHGDVLHWFKKHGKTMNDVRNDVAKLMGEIESNIPDTPATPVAPTVPPVSDEPKKYYRVRKAWDDSKSQIGAYTELKNAKAACDKAGTGYYVFDDKGTIIYPEIDVVTGTASTGSEADQKAFWDYFLNKLGNEYGVAGLMGNIKAESSFKSNNLQNAYESKLGYTDATYVAAVDNGSYTNFVNDSAGFGLAQWTFYSRKQKLIDYAKSKKKSIGDFQMQLDFMWEELQVYKEVLATLKSATSVLEASRSVHVGYERPANQTEENILKRASLGQEYYNKYASKSAQPEPEDAPEQTAPVVAKLTAGTKLNLKNVASYTSASAKAKSSIKTGTYYIWSSTTVNGRIRITNKTSNVGKIGQVTAWISAIDASNSMVANTNANTDANVNTNTQAAQKTLDDWANEVIKGKHGNGTIKRMASLKKAGCPYTYAQVQARVNKIYAAKR